MAERRSRAAKHEMDLNMEDLDTASPAPKKSSKVMTIAALAVLTLLAGGGGWLVGGVLAPNR